MGPLVSVSVGGWFGTGPSECSPQPAASAATSRLRASRGGPGQARPRESARRAVGELGMAVLLEEACPDLVSVASPGPVPQRSHRDGGASYFDRIGNETPKRVWM